jgi:hypothetical protein
MVQNKSTIGLNEWLCKTVKVIDKMTFENISINFFPLKFEILNATTKKS